MSPAVHPLARSELHDQMRIKAVPRIAAHIRAIRGNELANLVILRDQMQRRGMTQFPHRDGSAHRSSPERYMSFESAWRIVQ